MIVNIQVFIFQQFTFYAIDCIKRPNPQNNLTNVVTIFLIQQG